MGLIPIFIVFQVVGDISCESPPPCRNLKHFVGVFDEEEADIRWKAVKPEHLGSTVAAEVQQESYFGFVYVKCTNYSESAKSMQPWYEDEYAADENYVSHTQLFLYPKQLPKVVQKPKAQKKVNLNLIMIDSLSRTHFYRSLPKTVKFLESLYDTVHPKVFDFQYLQAVKQRTYESLEALFSGYVNLSEVPFGNQDIPKKPLPVSDLFGLYKDLGYTTLWLDLCWFWNWGLSKNLKVMNATVDRPALWKKFKDALAEAKIDRVDMLVASCDILEANGKKDPFHDLPAVCFNGQHDHEYILDYLQLFQAASQDSGRPFLTFSMSNVAHEETGLRVQTIDEPLSKYLKFASRLKNTITVLFSDHGNTYGEFIQASPEAHIETFHPFLFIIVPQDVQNLLGDVQMRIFGDNEGKLVSLIDVHNMLLQLAGGHTKITDHTFLEKYYTPGGLLSSISSTRTCSDIPLLQPNLCICRNFEVSVEPGATHMALADFGIGVLNNMILHQHRESGAAGFGNCRPFKPSKIRNARETRVSVDLMRYKLDVVVQDMQAKSDEETQLLFLTLEAGSGTSTLRLVSYERMSLYSVYSVCQDPTVELKLCLCDVDKPNYDNNFINSLIFGALSPKFNLFKRNRNFNAPSIETLTSPVLGTNPVIDFAYPSDNPCLFTIIHNFKSGIVLVGANFCSTIHDVEVLIEAENMNLSCEKHSKFLLHSGDVKMLLGGIMANPKVEWHWHHNIRIQ